MYKSFNNFREDREIVEFGQKYDRLCLAIIESGMTFDQFWIEHGLPFFINGGACNEQELIEGWNPGSWDWGGLWNGVKNSPTGQAVGAAGQALGGAAMGAAQGFAGSQLGKNAGNFFNPQQAGQPGATRQSPPQTPQSPPQAPRPPRPPLSANSQAKVGEAMKSIKKSFNDSMSGVVEKYKNNRDSVGYQLAKGFVDKVNAYAEKLKIQQDEGKFDQNAAFGPQTPPQTPPQAPPAAKDYFGDWKKQRAEIPPTQASTPPQSYADRIEYIPIDDDDDQGIPPTPQQISADNLAAWKDQWRYNKNIWADDLE